MHSCAALRRWIVVVMCAVKTAHADGAETVGARAGGGRKLLLWQKHLHNAPLPQASEGAVAPRGARYPEGKDAPAAASAATSVVAEPGKDWDAIWPVPSKPRATRLPRRVTEEASPRTVGGNEAERVYTFEMRMQPQTFLRPRRSVIFTCEQFDMAGLKPGQFVGYEPLIDKPKGLDLVHHIDVFLCDASLGDRFKDPESCHSFSAFMHSSQGPCYQLMFAYDRGASGFMLPPEVGMELGPRTPYSKLLLQIHYLMPLEMDPHTTYTDTSGVRLHITPDHRPNNGGVFVLLDYALQIPASKPEFKHSFECHHSYMKSVLEKDMAAQKKKEKGQAPGLTFYGTHLHAHSSGRQLWVDHMRDGKSIGTFGKNMEYKGYGASQSYVFYKPTDTYQKGDSLTGNCVFNSSKASGTVHYGVGHGDEMCAFILFYYPADPHNHPHVNHLCSLMPARDGASDKDRLITHG